MGGVPEKLRFRRRRPAGTNCSRVHKPCRSPEGLTELLGAFGGFEPLGGREVFEDGGDEIGAIAVFTVRHFIDLADEPLRKANGDLRHAGGTRADFSFLCHLVFWLLDKIPTVGRNRQDLETIKIQLVRVH